MSSPFKRMNGNDAKPTVQAKPPKPMDISEINEEDWPKQREAIIAFNIRREFSNLPGNSLAYPILQVGVAQPDGTSQNVLHNGMRVRQVIAKDLLCAAVSARIVNHGVIGMSSAIPNAPEEQAILVQAAMQMAHLMVMAFQSADAAETQELHKEFTKRLNEEYRTAREAKGTVKTRVIEE